MLAPSVASRRFGPRRVSLKLTRARVTDYRSIDDSGWVDVDSVTCLVGKNESGKTAFLAALKKLNPVDRVSGDFDLKDYPRKGYVKYRRRHKTSPAVVVRAEFRLDQDEIGEIEEEYGIGVVASPVVMVSKTYANSRMWDIQLNEASLVQNLISEAGLPAEIEERAEAASSIDELRSILERLEIKPPVVGNLLIDINSRFRTSLRELIVDDYLERYLPAIVYFDDYSTMRGRISIPDIRRRSENDGELDDADRTFMSLISLVGTDIDDLESQMDYEHLKAELESASISITDDVFEYWQQNRQLRVEFDLSNANPNDPPPLNEGTILHVRIWNNRHRVSVRFDERSKGFVWFFSFLAYFSGLELEDENRSLLLLLDEPGLNLHAMAQRDFLRFIDERLAPRHQVIYTTHSPFMIDLNRLGSVRTVQDMDDRGTVVSDDVMVHDSETVFPLQVAMGYQLAQSLFLAPHCLLVNSPSDQIYLQVLGEAVAAQGRPSLDPRWVTIPVGGADNLPTYVSLLGENYVNVAIMMDVSPKSRARIEAKHGKTGHNSPIKMVEVTKIRDADMEDLFDPRFYLKLVNTVYANELPYELTMKAISGPSPRIAQRIQKFFEKENVCGGQFDPYRPAAYLLNKHLEFRSEIDDSTVDKAASMFNRVNSLLSVNGSGNGASHYTNGDGNGAKVGASSAAWSYGRSRVPSA